MKTQIRIWNSGTQEERRRREAKGGGRKQRLERQRSLTADAPARGLRCFYPKRRGGNVARCHKMLWGDQGARHLENPTGSQTMDRPNIITDAGEILYRRYIKGNRQREAWLEQERENAEIASMIYDLRTQAGLTQKELADRIGTKQSVISRLEDADYGGHSLSMLRRIARALKQRLTVSVTAERGEPNSHRTRRDGLSAKAVK